MAHRNILNKLVNGQPLLNKHSSVYTSLNYVKGIPRAHQIEANLLSQGYCLFRNTNISKVEDLIQHNVPQNIFSSYLNEPRDIRFHKYQSDIFMNYQHGTDDRTKYASQILNVSDGAPSSNLVFHHSELTYTNSFPRIISFTCLETDQFKDGFTPFSNIIQVAKNLDPVIKEKLLKHGIKYWRIMPENDATYGKTWKKMFGVDNKQDAEKLCEQYGYEYEWTKDGCMKLQYVKPAFIECCDRKELSFANSLLGHHGSVIDNVEEWNDVPYQQRPLHSTYGDGSEFTKEELEYIHQLHCKYEMIFKWNVGDVLILDNLEWSHGRYPYQGERKIVAMMGLPLVRTPTIQNPYACQYQITLNNSDQKEEAQ